jgi:OTU domain-containing protein 6
MAAHEDDFAPFCELGQVAERGDEGNSLLPANYAAYVDRVRSSADWGGHLELRALSVALQRPIIVYSARSAEPLRIEEQQHDTINSDGISADEDSDFVPIRLSYHLNYYALGEHYNQVVPVEESGS